MVKICMYTPSAQGGHALYTKELLSSLSGLEAQDIKGLLVTSENIADQFRDMPYEVIDILPKLNQRSEFPNKRTWIFSRFLHYWRRESIFFKWLKSHNDIGVIHVQEFTPWLAPFYFPRIRRLGKQIIYTVHNVQPHSKRFLAGFYRFAWKRCDALIVHTDGLKDELSTLLGPDHPPIYVVPIGVWSTFGNVNIPATEERRSKQSLLFFGIIRENKGLHHLLDAMHHLKDFKLTIAGSATSYRSYFHREIVPRLTNLKAKKVEISLREEFIPDEDIPGLFLNSSALVLPYESFNAQSGVLYMALTYQLPVIVSDEGGLGETVEQLQIGSILSSLSPDAISSSVRKTHEIKPFLHFTDQLTKAKLLFSWHTTAELTADVYRRTAKLNKVVPNAD